MPLLRRDRPDKPAPPPQPEPLDALVGELRHPDPERRWSAARRLADAPGAAEHLAAALPGETEPRIVEAIFTSLIRRGGPESAVHLLPLLRSDDAALRGGAIEALLTMPADLDRHIEGLLEDPDSDVRIFAVDLTLKLPPARATALLCRVLDRDRHPNACAAAAGVLAEIGTSDAIPHLERCRDRFAGQPFLPFAISAAIESVSGRIDRA
jgi:HEAT repeat protein